MRYSMLRRACAALAAAALALGAAGAPQENPGDVLDHVRRAFDALRDAELTFTERTRFPQTSLEQRAQGKLYLKKDHKYRIETDEQTVVTDGATVWSYSPANHQVLIDRYAASDRSFTPEKILGGGTEAYAASILGREKAGGAECIVLGLVPRGEGSLLRSLHLWVDPSSWLVRRAELTDANGKVTTYTVSDIAVNPGLSDARFVMQIPPGAEVVDLR